MHNGSTLFLSSKERVLSKVTEILANNPDPSRFEDVCRELKTCAADFIKDSPQDALRYAGNRVLWNKQPLFHAVLLETYSREEVDVKKKTTLTCHAVYCYAKAGVVQLAMQCIERLTQQLGSIELLKTEADKPTNQAELPIFSAIVYEAEARAAESNEGAHLALVDLYQKATYFYAMAQQVKEAKQCVKKWLAVTQDRKHLFLYREVNNASNYAKNPLYCGVINELLGIHFLNNPRYGEGTDEDLNQDLGKLITLYGRAMRCYDKSRQIELLKKLVGAFRFIDERGNFLYKVLLNDESTRLSHPIMTAVFHEVYGNFELAAKWYQHAGYPSEASECEQHEKDRQQKREEKAAKLASSVNDNQDDSSASRRFNMN